MRPSRLVTTLLATGALLLAALATVPTVEAQQGVVNTYLTVSYTPPAGPYKPGEVKQTNVTFTYGWSPGAASTQPVQAQLEVVGSADWYNVTLEPTTVTFPAPQLQEGKAEALATLTITLAPNAPAFQKGNLTIKATAPQAGNLKEARGEKASTFDSAFVAKTNVSGPQEVLALDGGKAHEVLFKVRNDGNHEVLVKFDVEAGTAAVTIPADITLDVGEEKTVGVVVRTPWTEGMEGDVVLKAKSTPTAGEETGDQTTAKAHYVSTSAIPGPGLPLAAAAVALAVVALRRRSRA